MLTYVLSFLVGEWFVVEVSVGIGMVANRLDVF